MNITMKRIVLPLLLFTAVASFGQSSILKKASSVLNKAKSATGTTSLSNDDIVAGLKEALSVGARNSANKLSAADGFFANAAIKVLMPPEAKKVETALRTAGMGKLVDNAILSMNRAAEEASKSAAPIFVNAITSMSITDALNILKGSDTAATGFLRGKTVSALTSAFRPVIDTALSKTSATSYWKTVFDAYNRLPTTFNKINPDLAGYVTEKSLSGMFFQVAQEEQKIRKDPAARVSDILKKVFGS
jgi:hypothetical protein